MKLLHTRVLAGQQNILEVRLSRPSANVVLLDDANWWLYQRGQGYRPSAGGFYQTTNNVVRMRPPFVNQWNLVIDLGGQPGEITASYRLYTG